MAESAGTQNGQDQNNADDGANTENEGVVGQSVIDSIEDEKQANSIKQDNLFPKDKKEEQVQKSKLDLDEAPEELNDWALTRMSNPGVNTEDLMTYYGDSFDDLKSSEEYWEDANIRAQFHAEFSYAAKDEFLKFYENTQKEFSLAKMGQFQKQQGSYDAVTKIGRAHV